MRLSRLLLHVTLTLFVTVLGWSVLAKIELPVEVNGVLAAKGELRLVQSELSGKVAAVRVAEGDKVTAGTLVMEIDAQERLETLTALRSNVALLDDEMRKARLVGAEDTQLLRLAAEASRLRTQIKTLERELERAKVLAPCNGTVGKVHHPNVGMLVNRGDTLVDVIPDGTGLILECALPTRDARQLYPGLHATVTLDAYPAFQFGTVSGKVLSISPEVITKTGAQAAYLLKIEVDEPEDQLRRRGIALRIGFEGKAVLVTERKTPFQLMWEAVRKQTS
ncbi:MAG: HlyD family efflux transporter periplasmic adaptor subunit [Blastocatellia bacterium]|nr:HlyD family efflux transporter periplasmic adaptor subunit [Blastocatellia bacterium]